MARSLMLIIIVLALGTWSQLSIAGGWMTPKDYQKCQQGKHPTIIYTTKKRCGKNCIDVSNGCTRRPRRYGVTSCKDKKDCVAKMKTACKLKKGRAYWGEYHGKRQAWCVTY